MEKSWGVEIIYIKRERVADGWVLSGNEVPGGVEGWKIGLQIKR
jgi:hypothetical protein